MNPLSKDARNFVEGVTKYMQSDARGKQMLPRVQTLFTKVTTAAKRERVAMVTTVISLSEIEKKGVAQMLTRVVGHDVECHFQSNPDLLGGMRIQIADWIVDTSLTNQLTAMTQILL